MIKYNYTGAAALWEENYTLCCDPWTFGTDERQQIRRDFMRAFTHDLRDDKQVYIDFLQELIEELQPADNAKSRVWDFDLIKQYEELLYKMINFKGVI